MIPVYTALALQTRCDAVNQDTTADASRARMAATIARVSAQIMASKMFLSGFNGLPLKLIVLPEYWMTGFPLGEKREVWQARAAIDIGGKEDEAISAIAHKHAVFLCSNHYENDPNFPDLYFEANVVYAPSGKSVLRYRRLISLYTPSPFDVWDKNLDAYGADAVFPVAKTEIGVFGTIASGEILYPEIARACVFKGAEILLHPTSEVGSPGLTPKHISKMARASENMAYVVSASSGGIYGTPVLANSTDAMSAVIGWKGEVLSEASMGESMVANASLDIEGLRAARRRSGMTNFLSRLPIAAFQQAYSTAAPHAPSNSLQEGKMIERDAVLARQNAVIEALWKAGAIS